MRWLIAASVGVLFSCGALRGASRGATDSNVTRDVPAVMAAPPVISEIVFVGLRRIAAAAVQAQITSHEGAPLDTRTIQSDVKALARLGWFADIRVASRPIDEISENAEPRRVRLTFYLAEQPALVRVQYSGSRLLSSAQILQLLRDKDLTLQLGAPVDDYKLVRISMIIQSALAELAHPQARVAVEREETSDTTLCVRYEISDGPHLPVGSIQFSGHPEVAAAPLRHALHRIAPGGLFGSLRGKGAFTAEGFAEDRARVLSFYENHGFPEARVGNAETFVYQSGARRWTLWRLRASRPRLAVSIPIEAGPHYRFSSITVSEDLMQSCGRRCKKLVAFSRAQTGTAYSAKTADDLRHAWLVAEHKPSGRAPNANQVEATRDLDPDKHEVRVRIARADDTPYIVRRIEFRGQHRFSDRYLRRRIGLQEGRPFDERALENGLARLTRTGYFRQIHREDIHIHRNEVLHTADVLIRVSEAGQQRASFSGGQGQFGSTLGLAYSLFDLLQGEELLAAQLDVGPETLQLVLALVFDGFLGSRSSLAFSIFNHVLRPRFTSSLKGPFYTLQSEGANAIWSYALTQTNSVSAEYGLTHSVTHYTFTLPPSLVGLPSPDLRADTTSRAVGLGFRHDEPGDHFFSLNSVSGGPLGGTENVLRSSEEYARIWPDPLLSPKNAWAFRATFSGAGSYMGEMPFSARLLSNDSEVRGFAPGLLGPFAVVANTLGNGTSSYTALPAGANVITAANAEYRVPLGLNVQAVSFFDIGSGWLLPNWLGPTRPVLLNSTNGVLHNSCGLELRWTIPELQVPVRTYVAVNVLRLNRFLSLPDGSLLHAHNRLLSFGWALGNLF